MTKKILGLLLCGLMLACFKFEKPDKPEDLIPPKKMEALFYDLYVINAAKGVNKKILEKNGIFPEDYILEKHGIDSLRFANSNAYYAYDPEFYSEMLERVKAKMSKEKDYYEKKLQDKSKREKEKRDSLQQLKRKQK